MDPIPVEYKIGGGTNEGEVIGYQFTDDRWIVRVDVRGNYELRYMTDERLRFIGDKPEVEIYVSSSS